MPLGIRQSRRVIEISGTDKEGIGYPVEVRNHPICLTPITIRQSEDSTFSTTAYSPRHVRKGRGPTAPRENEGAQSLELRIHGVDPRLDRSDRPCTVRVFDPAFRIGQHGSNREQAPLALGHMLSHKEWQVFGQQKAKDRIELINRPVGFDPKIVFSHPAT